MLKHSLLIILASGFAVGSFAQKVKRKGVSPITVVKAADVPKYTVAQFAGKWQEISRKDLAKKESIPFTDTLLLRFFDEKVEVKDAISMRMSVIGAAQTEAPATLITAGDQYTVHQLSASEMVLDDGEFLRAFVKKDKFYSETVGHTKVSRDSFNRTINIDPLLLKGRWMVYSKKALPGTVSSDQPVIKSLELTGIGNDQVVTGNLAYSVSHTAYTEPCTVTIVEDNMVIDAGKNSFKLKTYKLDANEFVFGDTEGLLYYAKPY